MKYIKEKIRLAERMSSARCGKDFHTALGSEANSTGFNIFNVLTDNAHISNYILFS